MEQKLKLQQNLYHTELKKLSLIFYNPANNDYILFENTTFAKIKTLFEKLDNLNLNLNYKILVTGDIITEDEYVKYQNQVFLKHHRKRSKIISYLRGKDITDIIQIWPENVGTSLDLIINEQNSTIELKEMKDSEIYLWAKIEDFKSVQLSRYFY